MGKEKNLGDLKGEIKFAKGYNHKKLRKNHHGDMTQEDKMAILHSLRGILPPTVTKEEAREERLKKYMKDFPEDEDTIRDNLDTEPPSAP